MPGEVKWIAIAVCVIAITLNGKDALTEYNLTQVKLAQLKCSKEGDAQNR